MTRLTTAGIRREYGPRCAPASELVRLNLYGAGRITVRNVAVEAFKALNQVLTVYRYATRYKDTGAFNCRRITNGKGLSLHSFGVAVDLNWQSNPYGSRLITDMSVEMIAALLRIRTRTGEQLFRWGGQYSGNKDAMHWEVICSRADLASGVNWSTVAGTATRPPPPTKPPPPLKEYDEMATKNEIKEAVREVIAEEMAPIGDTQLKIMDRLNEVGGSLRGWVAAIAAKVGATRGEAHAEDPYAQSHKR